MHIGIAVAIGDERTDMAIGRPIQHPGKISIARLNVHLERVKKAKRRLANLFAMKLVHLPIKRNRPTPHRQVVSIESRSGCCLSLINSHSSQQTSGENRSDTGISSDRLLGKFSGHYA